MNRMIRTTLLLAALLPVAGVAQVDALARSMEGKLKVKPAAGLKARPFALDRVRLLDGPFKKAQDADHAYLLTLDVHRLLNGFCTNAGVEPKGEAYGGWERMDIAGHSLGHFLTAASQMYAATGDTKLRGMVVLAVSELKRCQRIDGMLAGFPEAQRVWDELSKGEVRSQPFNLNGIWVPWYNQHKLLDGLIAAYLYCDSSDALAVARGVADHAILVTKDLTPELWQRMLGTEHGGMNEVLANLYAYTGEQQYLDIAKKFHHSRVLDPLERGDRRLTGLHGNTQIPKAIGTARIFELTGEARYADISRNFWTEVIEDHTYVSGGNTMGEYFGPPKQLSARIGSNTTETCNTYNMLKLTQHLMCWSPSVELGDYSERALWNHILASVNTERYGVTYFLPLGMGVQKRFSSPTSDFTCCHGSGMENHGKYGGAIYYESGDTLTIDQFVSSELDWKEKGVKVRIDASEFPRKRTFAVKLNMTEPKTFRIAVRAPHWLTGPMTANLEIIPGAFVTHTSFGQARKGEYLFIERLIPHRQDMVWRDGDVIRVSTPVGLAANPMPGSDRRVSYTFGPLVLAGVWDDETAEFGVPPTTVTEDGSLPLQDHLWISQQDRLRSTLLRPRNLAFAPLYEIREERYSVFFDINSEAEWNDRVQQHRLEQERLHELESRTVEFVDVGSNRATRDNNLRSERSYTGTLNERRWRDARDGGWFEFDIKVDPEGHNQIMLTYWGSDGGNRVFDIVVDGWVLATQRLSAERQGEFFDVTHDVPLDRTKGKQKVTVRIQAKPGASAGGVFGVRMLRPANRTLAASCRIVN